MCALYRRCASSEHSAPAISVCVKTVATLQVKECSAVFAASAERLLLSIHPLLSDSAPTVSDNACGAAARLVATHASLLPTARVVGELLRHLPLQVDFEEAEPVVSALVQLSLGEHSAALDEHAAGILRALIVFALQGKVEVSVRVGAVRGLREMVARRPQLEAVLAELPSETQQELARVALNS
jgi:hypothetical protein